MPDPMPPLTEEEMRDASRAQQLKARYTSDPEFARLADDIHHSRMLDGPACVQCMEIAAERMKKGKA